MLAPGGGTRGITAAGAAELTRQRSQNISLPTRALGMALGAAETLVPPGQSLPEIAATNFRALGTAALNYIKYGVGGVVQPAFEQGRAIGTAAKAGDPHAQGAALAAVATTAAGAAALYGRAAAALPKRVAVDLTPLPKPPLDPLDIPAFQRRPSPAQTPHFATDQEVRLHVLRQRHEQHTAETLLPSVRDQPFVNDPKMRKIIAEARAEIAAGNARMDVIGKAVRQAKTQEAAGILTKTDIAKLQDRLDYLIRHGPQGRVK